MSPSSDMNSMMRRATNGSRMRVPAMGANPQLGIPPAYPTGQQGLAAQAAQNTPNILPPRQPGQVAPQSPMGQMPQSSQPPQGPPPGQGGMGQSPQGWTPPPGLMNPAVSQPPGQGAAPPRPPGQPMPTPPGQMGPGMPNGMPGQVRPPRHTILPPGQTARPEDYAYEPQPDRTWKMYPPGVASPMQGYQAAMPRAASTADLARMAQELGPYMQRREQMRQSTQAPLPPGFGNPNEAQGY